MAKGKKSKVSEISTGNNINLSINYDSLNLNIIIPRYAIDDVTGPRKYEALVYKAENIISLEVKEIPTKTEVIARPKKREDTPEP